MNIATGLTLSRIVISPIFLILYIYYGYLGIGAMMIPYILLLLLVLSELSDAFDGHLARKYDQVTDLGKVLDPMADSIFRISVFLSFTQSPVHLPLLWVFVLIYRDSVVSILRTLCALNGHALAARISGKLKAIFQAIAALLILLLMIPHSVGVISSERLQLISTWIIGVVAIYTAFSGVEYIVDNWNYIRETFHSTKK